jgi:hypothetical protein
MKKQNQIYHIFIYKRWHSSVVDILSFRGDECDTEHYVVGAKVKGGTTNK